MSKGKLESGSEKHGTASRHHAFTLFVSCVCRKSATITASKGRSLSTSVPTTVKVSTLRMHSSTFRKIATAAVSAILALALFVTGSGGGLLLGVSDFFATLPQANAATVAPDIHLQQVAIDIDGNVTKTINTRNSIYNSSYTYSTAGVDTYPNFDAKVYADGVTYQFVGLYYEADVTPDPTHPEQTQKRSIEVGSIGYYDKTIEDADGTNQSYYVIHPKDDDNKFPNEQYVDLLATQSDLEQHLFAKFYSLNDMSYITYEIPDWEKNSNGGDIKISSDNKLDSYGRQWVKKGQSTTITIDYKRDKSLVMKEDTWNTYKLDGWELKSDNSQDKAIPLINVNRVNLNALSEDEQYWQYYKDWRENKAAFTNNDPAAKEVGRTVQTYVVTPNKSAKATNLKLSTTAKTVAITPISKTQNYNTPGFNFGSDEDVWGLGTQWPFVARQWGRDIPSGNSDPKNDVSMAKARYQSKLKNWDWWFNPESQEFKKDTSYNWGYFSRIIKSPTFDTNDGTIEQWNATPLTQGYSGLPFRTGVDWTFDYWGLTADTRTCGNSAVPTMRNLDTSDRAASCAAGEQENWHFGSAYMTDFVLNGQHFAVPVPTAPITRAKVTDLYVDSNGNPIDHWTEAYKQTRDKNLNTKYQSENNEDLGSWQVRYHVTEGKNAGAVISMKLYNFRSVMDCPNESDGDCQEDESHNGYEVRKDIGSFATFTPKGALNNRDLPVSMKNHDYLDRADGPWLGGTTRSGDNQNNCVWTNDNVKYNDVSPGITYRQDSARCLYKFATRVEINLENLQNERNDWYVTYQDYKSSHAKLVQTEGVETADGTDGIEIFAASDINKNDYGWQNMCNDTSMSNGTSKCPDITNWQWQKQPGPGGLIDNTPESGNTARDVSAFMRVHYKNGYISAKGYTDEQGRGILRSSFDSEKTIAPRYGEALSDLSVNWNDVEQLNPDEYGYLQSGGYINSFDDAAYFVAPMIPVNQSYFKAGGVNRYIDAGGQQMLQVPTRPYDVPVRYANKDGVVLAGMPALADQTDTVNVKDDFSYKVDGVVPVRAGNAAFVGYDVYQCAAGDPNAMRSLQDDQCTRVTDTVMAYFPGETFDIRQFEHLKLSNPNGTIATQYLRLVPAEHTMRPVPEVYTFDFRGVKTDGTVLHDAFQLTDKPNDFLTFRGVPGLKARLNINGINAVRTRMDAIHNTVQGQDFYTDKVFTSGGKQTIMHRDVNPQTGPWYWASKDEIGMTTGLRSQNLGSGPVGSDGKKGVVSLGDEPDPFYFYYEQTAAQITVDVAYKFIDAATGKAMPYTPQKQSNNSPYGINTRIAFQLGSNTPKTAEIGKPYEYGVGENVTVMYDSYVEQQLVPGCPVEPNEASIERTGVDDAKKNTAALYPNEKAYIADRDAGSTTTRYSRNPKTYSVTMEKGDNNYTLTLTYKCSQSYTVYSGQDFEAYYKFLKQKYADGHEGEDDTNSTFYRYLLDLYNKSVPVDQQLTLEEFRAYYDTRVAPTIDQVGGDWKPFHTEVKDQVLADHPEPWNATTHTENQDGVNDLLYSAANVDDAADVLSDLKVRQKYTIHAGKWQAKIGYRHNNWDYTFLCPGVNPVKEPSSGTTIGVDVQPGQNLVCYFEYNNSELSVLFDMPDSQLKNWEAHAMNSVGSTKDLEPIAATNVNTLQPSNTWRILPMFGPFEFRAANTANSTSDAKMLTPEYYLLKDTVSPKQADIHKTEQWTRLETAANMAKKYPDAGIKANYFYLYRVDADGNALDTTTDKNGNTIPLPVETKDQDHLVIKVKVDAPISYVIPDLPHTGGSAATTFFIIGGGLLAAGLGYALVQLKKREQE